MNASDGMVMMAVFLVVGMVFFLTISYHRVLEAYATLQGRFDMLQMLAMQQQERLNLPAMFNSNGARAESAPPQVLISRDVLNGLAAGINRDRRITPNVEHGFALVGRIDGDGEARRIVVTGMIDAGPNARKYHSEIKFDRDYQQRELETLQLFDPRASHIGDAHLHPGSFDQCSGGDLRTDRANVMASNTKEMVFGIATVMREHSRPQIDPNSFYVDGLKIDFFYLGSASRFRYVKVKPREIDEPALALPPVLVELIARNPERARFDWPSLCSLSQFKVRLTAVDDPSGSYPCVELTHRRDGWIAMIVLGESNDAPPHVYIDHAGQLEHFDAPIVAEKWSSHIWLTEIALALDGEMKARKQQTVAVTNPRISAFADDRIDPSSPFE